MDEEKKKFRVAGMVILWVFLLASLGLNGYLLIKGNSERRYIYALHKVRRWHLHNI